MNKLVLSIGSIVVIIGLAIIVLTIVLLRENRVKNILTGVVYALIGVSIIWLDFQGNSTFQINIGFSEKHFSFLLSGFVIGLFILKGFLDIREGSKNLQNNTISLFQVFKSKFQIIVAIIVTSFAVLIALVLLMQLGR